MNSAFEQLLACSSLREAKAGTAYFYRIAGIYLMLKGIRVTLGVVFVHSGMSLVEAVSALLEKIKAQAIDVNCLYLDRGFATISIYRYFLEHVIPALIARPYRGKPGAKGRSSLLSLATARHLQRSSSGATQFYPDQQARLEEKA